jgi:hypothetical protein
MELISDNATPKHVIRFAAAWFGGLLLMLWLVFNWMIVGMLVLGAVGFFYYWTKVKDVYSCGESIKIQSGNVSVEIPIDNIVDVNSKANLYRINFHDKTEFGYYIRFTPRLEGKFFTVKPHSALAELIEKVNS